MISIQIYKFEDPTEVLLYMSKQWGGYGNRWDLIDLEDLRLTNEADLTFLLLKFKLRKIYDQ